MATSPVALLFGSEKFGLGNDDISHCHWLMRIPTVDPSRSMNLGQAVAVCLYEIARTPAKPIPPKKVKPATADQIERITQMLLEASRRSGYMNAVVAGLTENKVRGKGRGGNITGAD